MENSFLKLCCVFLKHLACVCVCVLVQEINFGVHNIYYIMHMAHEKAIGLSVEADIMIGSRSRLKSLDPICIVPRKRYCIAPQSLVGYRYLMSLMCME
jgi:hypothetical protein